MGTTLLKTDAVCIGVSFLRRHLWCLHWLNEAGLLTAQVGPVWFEIDN